MPAASADLRALAADLAFAAGTGPEQAAHKLLASTATQVAALAQAKAPRDTGKLSSSIQITWVSKTDVIIGPSVAYGVFQEFGTASRGEFPGQAYEIRPKTKPFLVFQVNGKTVVTRRVIHPGVKAQPYMRPALQQALEPFTEALAEKGQLLITKGPRSAL